MILEENNSLWKTRQTPPATVTPEEDPGAMLSSGANAVFQYLEQPAEVERWENEVTIWLFPGCSSPTPLGMTLCKL